MTIELPQLVIYNIDAYTCVCVSVCVCIFLFLWTWYCAFLYVMRMWTCSHDSWACMQNLQHIVLLFPCLVPCTFGHMCDCLSICRVGLICQSLVRSLFCLPYFFVFIFLMTIETFGRTMRWRSNFMEFGFEVGKRLVRKSTPPRVGVRLIKVVDWAVLLGQKALKSPTFSICSCLNSLNDTIM